MTHLFKKTSLALIIMGLSSAAFANGGSFTAPAKSDFAVTVPNQAAGWHFGANGLIFQLSNRDMSYPVPGNTAHEVQPSYQFGYDVNAGYHLAGTGSDISANFEYYNSSDTAAAEAFVNFGPVVLSQRYEATNDLDYWAVDLMGHEAVDVGNHLDMKVGAGLRYANIDNEFSIRNFTARPSGRGNKIENETDAWGIGPRLTLDGFYDICNGFGIESGFGASLLYGQTDYTRTDRTFNVDGSTATVTKTKLDDSNHVIPELDLKLGLGYNYKISKTYSVNFHAGWKTTTYFDVLDNSGTAGTSTSNLSMSGPYFGITARG